MRLIERLLHSINEPAKFHFSNEFWPHSYKWILKFKEKLINLFQFQHMKTKNEMEKMAHHWVDELTPEAFDRLKKDIFRLVIYTFYQRKSKNVEEAGKLEKVRPIRGEEAELSIYDIAKSERDLFRLNQLNDESWRGIIKEMVTGSLEIMQIFEKNSSSKLKQKARLKVALINIAVLRRATFKII